VSVLAATKGDYRDRAGAERADQGAWSLWSEKRGDKTLREGDLYYEERWDNNGGYAVGYDVKEKRGYYSYSHR